MTMSECFICLEGGGRQRCNCSLHVHDECLTRLLASIPNHNGRCAACKSTYTETQMSKRYVCNVTHGKIVLFTYLLFFLVASITIITFLFHHVKVLWGMSWSMLGCSSIMITIVMHLHYTLRRKIGRFCCIHCRTMEHFTINPHARNTSEITV